jgi:hypothetical protein
VSKRFYIDDAHKLACDIDTLVDTRLLVQSNSGGGKSWAVRHILEKTHGKVQHLVLDPEGEFASLREEYDYVHAARAGGDTVAHPRSAGLLAERLLELGVSAVLDLYELKAHERIQFVRLFLEALIEAPKRLWHPALVVVDEAHVFCPQVGSAESASAVIDLCSRGRKRGYSAMLATQRIAKLHKDAAAELNNKLIGRTSLDVDLLRASDELGFPKARWGELKELTPGSFFASGPAFSQRGVVPVKVGAVLTTHPKAGARIAHKPPPPTSKIKALLPKLSDLPAEAEERAKSVEELRQEVARLKRELAAKPVPPPAPPAKPIEVPVVGRDVIAAFELVRDNLREGLREIREAVKIAGEIDEVANKINATVQRLSTKPILAQPASREPQPAPRPAPRRRTTEPGADRFGDDDAEQLGSGERAVLVAVAQHGDAGVSREQVTVLTGFKTSTRNAYLQRLRLKGLVGDEPFVATERALALLGPDFEPLPTGSALLTHWLDQLPSGEAEVLRSLTDRYPEYVSRDEVTRVTGFKTSTRNAYLQRLGARKLTQVSRDGVQASPILFD